MANPGNLANHLRQRWLSGKRPRTEAADAKIWFLALEELIRTSALDEAAFAAAHLAASFPDSLYIGRLAMLLERMPAAVVDPEFANFRNDAGKDVQILPRAGATDVLFAFCGRHGSLGFPLPIAHRWFGELGAHVVYLRDPAGELYTSGIPSLAKDRAGTVQELRAIADRLEATRTLCCGNSNGGYAALLYGLELQSAAVLAFNALTIFPAEQIERRVAGDAVYRRAPPPDVAASYESAPNGPRAHLVYGADNLDDAASAARMANIPGVSTHAVPSFDGHDAHIALIERGLFGGLLRDFMAGWPDDDER